MARAGVSITERGNRTTEKSIKPPDAYRFKNRLRFWFTLGTVGSFLLYPPVIVTAFKFFGGDVAALVALGFTADIGVCAFFIGRFPDIEISSGYLGFRRYLAFIYIRWERVQSAEAVDGRSPGIRLTYRTRDGKTARENITLSGYSSSDRQRLKDLIFHNVPGARVNGTEY